MIEVSFIFHVIPWLVGCWTLGAVAGNLAARAYVRLTGDK